MEEDEVFGFGPAAYAPSGSVAAAADAEPTADHRKHSVLQFPGVAPQGEDEASGINRRSYEEDLALFQEILEKGEETLWEQAQAAALMEAKYGRDTAKMLASDTGLSASYIRMITATYKAFPTPESRVADLSFSHHRIAAGTDDPEKWIEHAAEHDLSCGDLRQAIAQARDRMSEFQKAQKAEDRIMRLVKKYNEQFSQLMGKTVAALWNEAEVEQRRVG